MLSEMVDTDTLHGDEMHVVCPRAAGLDVHKKTDAGDSLWLARICRFGLALPSYVPPRRFRRLRRLTRYRRTLVAERSRTRNRAHETLDHDGLRLNASARLPSHVARTAAPWKPPAGSRNGSSCRPAHAPRGCAEVLGAVRRRCGIDPHSACCDNSPVGCRAGSCRR